MTGHPYTIAWSGTHRVIASCVPRRCMRPPMSTSAHVCTLAGSAMHSHARLAQVPSRPGLFSRPQPQWRRTAGRSPRDPPITVRASGTACLSQPCMSNGVSCPRSMCCLWVGRWALGAAVGRNSWEGTKWLTPCDQLGPTTYCHSCAATSIHQPLPPTPCGRVAPQLLWSEPALHTGAREGCTPHDQHPHHDTHAHTTWDLQQCPLVHSVHTTQYSVGTGPPWEHEGRL
jgi:hypothetical protein